MTLCGASKESSCDPWSISRPSEAHPGCRLRAVASKQGNFIVPFINVWLCLVRIQLLISTLISWQIHVKKAFARHIKSTETATYSMSSRGFCCQRYMWRKLSIASTGRSLADFPRWCRGWVNLMPSAVKKFTIATRTDTDLRLTQNQTQVTLVNSIT